jgi:hypothetical protein
MLAPLSLMSAVLATAATLGGLTPGKLGAEDVGRAACDTNGVNTSSSPAWDTRDRRYEVSSVTVKGVADACDGQTLTVTVTDAGGNVLSTGKLHIPTGVAVNHSVPLAAGISPESASADHVIIGT